MPNLVAPVELSLSPASLSQVSMAKSSGISVTSRVQEMEKDGPTKEPGQELHTRTRYGRPQGVSTAALTPPVPSSIRSSGPEQRLPAQARASTDPMLSLVLTPTTLGDQMNLGVAYRTAGFSRDRIDGSMTMPLDQLEQPMTRSKPLVSRRARPAELASVAASSRLSVRVPQHETAPEAACNHHCGSCQRGGIC